MGGVYNKKETDEGIPLWEKDMRVDVVAIDINTEINATQTKIIGEAAHIWVELPKNISLSRSLNNGVLLQI